MYNKVYHKNLWIFSDLFIIYKKRKKKVVNQTVQYSCLERQKATHSPKEYKEAGLVFMFLGAIFLFISTSRLLFVYYWFYNLHYWSFNCNARDKKKKVEYYSPQIDSIVSRDDFLLMETNYHQEEAEISWFSFSKGVLFWER